MARGPEWEDDQASENHMKGPRPKLGHAILDILQGALVVSQMSADSYLKPPVTCSGHSFSS